MHHALTGHAACTQRSRYITPPGRLWAATAKNTQRFSCMRLIRLVGSIAETVDAARPFLLYNSDEPVGSMYFPLCGGSSVPTAHTTPQHND